jgi:hypothetical protein
MDSTRLLFVASVAVMSLGCPGLGSQQPPTSGELPEEPTWSEHVKPIMDIHCNECHSVPPQQAAPGSLRLDTCETVGGIPGAQAQAARIIVRTIDKTPTPMPPANYETTPTPDEEEILQRWFDQGAKCDGGGPTNNTQNNMMNNTPSDMGDLDGAMDMGTTDLGVDTGADMPDAADMTDEAEMYDGWVFADVADFMRNTCSNAGGNCHDTGQGNLQFAEDIADDDLRMVLMGNAMNNPADVPFVTPEDPLQSAIHIRMTDAGDIMPPGGAMQAQADEIEAWINAGAPGF